MHRVLRLLTVYDLFMLGGMGLVQPIFAVFLLSEVNGSTVIAVGIATTIQLVTKALFQIFVGRWTDVDRGNNRELVALLIGSVFMSLVPFGYALSGELWQIYAMQFLYGLGFALVYPAWMVIFTRYSRKDKAGYEWGTYNTVVSLGTAMTAALGASLAHYFSFQVLFLVFGGMSVVGTSLIIGIFKSEFVAVKKK